jgi:hypothetical protein
MMATAFQLRTKNCLNISNSGSDKLIYDIKIGGKFFFEPNTLKKYVVKNIAIRHLVGDLEILK